MEHNWTDRSVMDKLTYVHAKVCVTTVDKKELSGLVYTVDPVTHSIVLYVNGQLVTVLGHSVSNVAILEKPNEEIKEKMDSFFVEKSVTHDPILLEHRKTKLIAWLQKNRFPVEISDEKLTVANALDILPPYNSDSCETSNEIILGRVQKLIQAMPDL